MNKKTLFRYIPFVIIVIIHLYAWVVIATTDKEPAIGQWAALLLIGVNLLLYIKKMAYGLLATAIILVLSSLSIIEIYAHTITGSFFVRIGQLELATPHIQWRSVGLLVLYCILNFNYWIELYADYKYGENK
ncbi:hypothetical protein SAMN05421788_103119 [Filimonas lacunae]|uniref:Transmembrane family 220, helix n=1 Tax=Filimonas lacunae TaxID=477680 RepID=A0A173MJW6_9BACT|nr:hypothetical protein [Filimonas lacunae]BAV07769.1 hypothetical protein FLA_3800 [Filimonas lacunae]SIT04540.1 hypothetical protein SAMN05421788_103119 [Filimonas lacunae]